MKQWRQFSSNNELLGQLPQLQGFVPHTHSVLWSPKHPKVLVDWFWVFRYSVMARFLCSVTFINFQSDCSQIKQWVTFRWSWDLLFPLLKSLLDIELGRAHSDCVWFVSMEMPFQVFCLFYLVAFFWFYGEEVEELLTYSRLKFLVRYLLRILSFSLHLRPQEPVKVREKDGEVSRRLYLKGQTAPLWDCFV